MKTYFKKNFTSILIILVMSLGVSTLAYAQFVVPGSAPTAGNILAPLNLGTGLAQKFGNFWVGMGNGIFTSTNGFAFQTQTATTSWAAQSGLSTLSVEQFCLGTYCISSLKVPTTPTDIYVTQTSCSGGPCAGDPYVAAGICQANGLSHLVSAVLGGATGNSITRVTCDMNGTSPTSSSQITITNANGSTNILTANTPKSGGGGTGGGGCKNGTTCNIQ